MSDRKNPEAAESGHWYHRDGKPCYEVENKSKPGTFRPTTLRDAKKLDLIPSVTTILKVIDKPALKNYIKRQVAEACLCLTEGELMLPDGEKFKRIMELADEHRDQAADLGTLFHAHMEKALADPKYKAADTKVQRAITVAKTVLGGTDCFDTIANERTVLADAEGVFPYAGKLDAIISLRKRHSLYGAQNWVATVLAECEQHEHKPRMMVDIKVRGSIKKCYPEDIAQLEAYARASEATDFAKIHFIANLLVDSKIFDDRFGAGDIKREHFNLVIHDPQQREKAWRYFVGACGAWFGQKDLTGSWTPEPLESE